MWIFQRPYDWLKSLQMPVWLKRILGIANVVMMELLKQLGEEAVNFLRSQIYEQSKKDLSGSQKLENVFNAFKLHYAQLNITDSLINFAIETLLAVMKSEEIIKSDG